MQGARVLGTPHMRFDSMNGTDAHAITGATSQDLERSTRQVHILACNPSNAARRELPDDMRLSNRDEIVDECGSGGHPQPHDLPSANVPNTWASKRHAAVLDPADWTREVHLGWRWAQCELRTPSRAK